MLPPFIRRQLVAYRRHPPRIRFVPLRSTVIFVRTG